VKPHATPHRTRSFAAAGLVIGVVLSLSHVEAQDTSLPGNRIEDRTLINPKPPLTAPGAPAEFDPIKAGENLLKETGKTGVPQPGGVTPGNRPTPGATPSPDAVLQPSQPRRNPRRLSDNSPNSSVGLTYLEKLPPNPAAGGGTGGLAGQINRIAMQIAGAGGADKAGAASNITVQPLLEHGGEQPWAVRLRVTQNTMDIDPAISAASRVALQQENAFLSQQLSQWSMELSPEMTATLRERGSLSLPVSRPLSAIKKWSRGSLSVTVVMPSPAPQVASVRFYNVGRSGIYPTGELIDGMPAFAEVVFDREPEMNVVVLELSGGAGAGGVRAVKLQDQPTVFRTSRFLPWKYDGGLGVPPSLSPGRSPRDTAIPNVVPKGERQ
jgi:hypothetical protein